MRINLKEQFETIQPTQEQETSNTYGQIKLRKGSYNKILCEREK